MIWDRLKGLIAGLNIAGRDIIALLVSLLLAFSIWLIHNLSLSYSATMSVPVVAECNLEGHSNISSNSSTISARCRTTGFILLRNRHQSKREAVHIKFASKDMVHKEGEFFFISSAELASYVSELFGDDTRLEAFLSESVQFRFPVENNKKVPVQPVDIITFKDQYMAMGPVHLQPDSVIIYGEPFQLENIDRVLTRTIDLPSLHSSAHGVVKLEQINGIRMSDTEVKYTVDVTRFVEIESNVTVHVRNVPAGKRVSVLPSVAKVVYRCAFPLSADPTQDVQFYIDYKDFEISKGGKCVPYAGRLPEGVIDYTVSPEVFDCVEEGKL